MQISPDFRPQMRTTYAEHESYDGCDATLTYRATAVGTAGAMAPQVILYILAVIAVTKSTDMVKWRLGAGLCAGDNVNG
jgi:hypothetical protein